MRNKIGELMSAQELEKIHRQALAEFNRRHLADAVYYRDAILDPEIKSLMHILNNEWTITTFSCGGHWAELPKFQYPYVCFFVHNQHEQWIRITQQTWQILAADVSERATVQVFYDFYVPEQHISGMSWYLVPASRKTHWVAEKLYRNELDFRRTMDRLIARLCDALNVTMNAERGYEKPALNVYQMPLLRKMNCEQLSQA